MDYFDFVTVNWAKVPADLDSPDPVFDHVDTGGDRPEYPLYGSPNTKIVEMNRRHRAIAARKAVMS